MKTKEEVFKYFDIHGFSEETGFDLGCDVAMTSMHESTEAAAEKASMYNEAVQEYVSKNNISFVDNAKFCVEYMDALVK